MSLSLYSSETGLAALPLDTTCWSCVVELLNAFLMLMSCRETRGRNGQCEGYFVEFDHVFYEMVTGKEKVH